jgi:hypothetical protein
MNLNSKQRRTLEMVFEKPIRSEIRWTAIMNLFEACDAEVLQGRGSRVRVIFKCEDDEIQATFHTPHPQKERVKGAVVAVRDLLTAAGITPNSSSG